MYFDSSAKVGQSVDDGGNLGTMVRPANCTGGQAIQSINANGTAQTWGYYKAPSGAALQMR